MRCPLIRSLLPSTHHHSGGLDSVFGGATSASLDVPATATTGGGDEGASPAAPTTTVAAVVAAAKAHLLTGRPDLFLSPDGSGSVRPGILVLVNDTDWELW